MEVEVFKNYTDKEVKCPVKASLKMVNAGKLKLLGQNLPAKLAITNDSIVVLIYNKKDLKNPIFNTEMYFSKINKIEIKEASLTKEKIIEIIGIDKAFFKFSISKINGEENVNNFINNLPN